MSYMIMSTSISATDMIYTRNKEEEIEMSDFLKFFNEKSHDFPMHLEIYYSKVMELCFARAHVALKNWLLEYEGGY